MKALRTLIILLIASSCLINVAYGSTANGIWTVTVSPNFAFSGDNITIGVTGYPQQFVIVEIWNSTGGMMLDTSLFTDDIGRGFVEYPLPYDMPSGTYTISIIMTGIFVANTTIDVVFDDMVYMEHQMDELIKENAKLNERVVIYTREVIQTQSELEQLTWLFYSELILMGALIVFIFAVFKKYLEWRAVHYKGQNPLLKAIHFITNLPADGDHRHYIDGQQAEIMKDIGGREAVNEPEKKVILTTKGGQVIGMVDQIQEVALDGPVILEPTKDGVILREMELQKAPSRPATSGVVPKPPLVSKAPVPPPSTSRMTEQEELALRLKRAQERELKQRETVEQVPEEPEKAPSEAQEEPDEPVPIPEPTKTRRFGRGRKKPKKRGASQ